MSVILDYPTLRMALMDRRDAYIEYAEKCSDPAIFDDKIKELEDAMKNLEGSEEVMILSRTV
jgi:hypothetical protein